jgi:hypothetical protein
MVGLGLPEAKKMARENGYVGDGFRRVWRYQRALWWLFIINLVLAQLSAAPLAARWQALLDHSISAADDLYRSFNVARYVELASQPEIGFGSAMPGMGSAAVVFFFFMLLVTGGILEAYRSEQKLRMSEFFEAGAACFWRFLRLVIMFLIVLAPVAILAFFINKWSGHLSDNAEPEKFGFYVELIGGLLVLFLLMCERLWFDMAQVHSIATNDGAVRSMVRGFRLTFGNFGSLFWIYFLPSLVAWVAMFAIWWMWAHLVPNAAVSVSFLLMEIWMLVWLGTRLWQRGAETAWYQRNQVAEPAYTPVTPVSSPGQIAFPEGPGPVPAT